MFPPGWVEQKKAAHCSWVHQYQRTVPDLAAAMIVGEAVGLLALMTIWSSRLILSN
ncbi:hypothetical protein AA0228_2978 [Gluconobacter frateurii NRIC 0228]|uniref:Uncharacterized protein n=1 Tax=Gluconobacter frateurii NRIC 0228 TaxID=1307946 RepID=A0ABQ0QFL5_9PROT|nr:hypothetical protein AA0228_2978 [Gluconobacter frateurii NRIC 0228]